MRSFLTAIYLLLSANIASADWHTYGRVYSREFPDLRGQYKINVQIDSGGVWIGRCGGMLANLDGTYDVTCSPGFNVFGGKRVAVFHRLGDGKCHIKLLEGVDEKHVDIEISSSDEKTVYGCLDDKY
ncbi:unnamed protein product [Bursaphelenchus xylophilus]|uniref:(pine wood nematode) hypothetical protein n=1 Tax=Bursaphelenchus xylophilus TaxID=6326 RepID=A0A1I7SEM0_BURXY|nr:unnamed protein product [Bursaphelenchus xylophilus]CAG9113637.1 unnamed protein product [Bursaphelenchus xylophilus]